MLIKKKSILLLIISFITIYFIVHDLQELIEFFEFDVNAPDLTIDGVEARNKYFGSYYDPSIMYHNFTVNTLVIFPLMFLVSLYYYNKIKSKNLKFLIGKTNNINKYLLQLKFKVAILPCMFYVIALTIYTFVSWYIRDLRVRPGADFSVYYLGDTILSFLNGSLYGHLFMLYFVGIIYIIATILFLTTIVDYNYNYIIVAFLYFVIMSIANDFIIMYVSRYLGLDASYRMLAIGSWKNIQIIISYIYMVLIYIFFRFTHKKEF